MAYFGLLALLLIALLIAGAVAGLLAWNVRRPSGPSVALALSLSGLSLWMGLETAPFIPGLVSLAVAAATIAAACFGLARRWPRSRWITRMLWTWSLSLAVLWAGTSAFVFWPRPARFVEPLAGLPEGCPYFYEDAEAQVQPVGADAPVEAELGPRGIRLHDERGRSLELIAPTAPRDDVAQYLGCSGPPPVHVGRRREDEYCVGYDPAHCTYMDPHVIFVDRALRPWPGGALSRLEARCGSLLRYGYLLAGLATLALVLVGLLARRRWRGLLASSDPSAGRWRGVARARSARAAKEGMAEWQPQRPRTAPSRSTEIGQWSEPFTSAWIDAPSR